MEPHLIFAVMGLFGFIIPVFFLVGRDRSNSVSDPSLDEMRERERRAKENE